MKRHKTFLTALATLLAMGLLMASVGCKQQQEHQNIIEEVKQASRSWIKHFNKGDAVYCTNAYTANAKMVAKPFGTFRGRKAILAFWKPFIASGAGYLEYYETKLKVIDTKTVRLSASWSMNVGRGIITNETWVKQDNGKWLLSEDHFQVKEKFKKLARK